MVAKRLRDSFRVRELIWSGSVTPGLQQPFYEAGSCQEEFGVDWFTLLSEFPPLAYASLGWSHSTVRRVSFWASSFSLRVATSFSLSQSVSEPSLSPLELTASHSKLLAASPLVLTSAITSMLTFRLKQPRGYRFLSRSAKASDHEASPNSALTTSSPRPQWRSSCGTSCRR